jgi:hypothetical protein
MFEVVLLTGGDSTSVKSNEIGHFYWTLLKCRHSSVVVLSILKFRLQGPHNHSLKRASPWIKITTMKKRHWIVAGLAAGAGGALFYVLRCRHARTSFPITRESVTYITCLKCGLHRLYDTKNMQGYGPWTITPAAAVEPATAAAIRKGLTPDRQLQRASESVCQ